MVLGGAFPSRISVEASVHLTSVSCWKKKEEEKQAAMEHSFWEQPSCGVCASVWFGMLGGSYERE